MDARKGDLRAIVLAGGRGTRMESDLPKVLHELRGKTIVRHAVDNLREAGIDDVIAVVGYRRDLVMEHLEDRVRFAVQEEQLGTGHAVRQALPLLEEATGSVLICYGDMPFLGAATVRALVDARSRPDVAGAILTMVLDDPPDYGRVVRDGDGPVKKVVEVRDCSSEELEIREFNVGVYCFGVGALRQALPRLTDDNAQREYYLTDLVQVLAEGGRRVETVRTDRLEEALGINDRVDLEFARRLGEMSHAEHELATHLSRSDAGDRRSRR